MHAAEIRQTSAAPLLSAWRSRPRRALFYAAARQTLEVTLEAASIDAPKADAPKADAPNADAFVADRIWRGIKRARACRRGRCSLG